MRSWSKKLPWVLVLLVSFGWAVPVAVGQPKLPVDEGGLGKGHYARMQALIEKTLLRIDVAKIWIHFDEPTARAVAKLAGGHAYSEEVESAVAGRAYRAEDAVVSLRFERHIALEDFVEAVRADLRRALKAGMIDEQTQRKVSGQLPSWFSFLKKRGFREGDTLFYRVRPNSLRGVYVDKSGRKLLDRSEQGASIRLALLASYFAPGSDFREPLVRSLWLKR